MALLIGNQAPEFKTKDQDGKEVRLSDFRGKKVVLYFYPKDMTPGCTAEACSLRDNYRALQKAGYEILGVSTDDERSHQKFIAKEKLPFRLLADTDKSLHASYGTWVKKSMYGREYMGTARVTYIINERGIIEEVIEKVDTKNHAAQILGQAPPIKPAVKKSTPSKSTQKAILKSSKGKTLGTKKSVKKVVKKTATKKK
jgi:thioredoxin-dependent peroxiredoxin